MVLEVCLFLWPLVSAPGSEFCCLYDHCFLSCSFLLPKIDIGRFQYQQKVEGRRAKEAGGHEKHRRELGGLVQKKARGGDASRAVSHLWTTVGHAGMATLPGGRAVSACDSPRQLTPQSDLRENWQQ